MIRRQHGFFFEQATYWQEQLTQKVYASADCSGTQPVTAGEFREWLDEERALYDLPPQYNGYYDGRQPAIPEPSELLYVPGAGGITTPEELFAPEYTALPKKIESLNTEIALLRQMEAGEIQVTTFDFDGKKYERSDAASLAEQLTGEEETLRMQLKEHDLLVVRYFIEKSAQGRSLEMAYRSYFSDARLAADYQEALNKTILSLQPIINGELKSVEDANRVVDELRIEREPVVKTILKQWLEKGVFDGNPATREEAEKFLASEYHYFSGTSFFENELISLHQLCESSWQSVNLWLFINFKKILLEQLPVFSNQKTGAVATDV